MVLQTTPTGFDYIDAFIADDGEQTIADAAVLFFKVLAEPQKDKEEKCTSCIVKHELTQKLFSKRDRKIKFHRVWERWDHETAELLFRAEIGDEVVVNAKHPTAVFLFSIVKNKIAEEI